MKGWGLVAFWGACGLVAVSGVASAETWSSETLFSTPAKASGRIAGSFVEDVAQELRDNIDQQAGDQDGTVETAEVDLFERLTQLYLNDGGGAADLYGSNFTIDGKAPTLYNVSRVEILNAEGSVLSRAPIDARFEFNITWDVASMSRHIVRTASEASPGSTRVWERTLVVPSGYYIFSTTGLPEDSTTSSDMSSVTSTSPDSEATNVTLVYEKRSTPSTTTSKAPSKGPTRSTSVSKSEASRSSPASTPRASEGLPGLHALDVGLILFAAAFTLAARRRVRPPP